MAVITTIQCDKCGKIVGKDKQTPALRVGDREYDLCPDCREALLAGLEGKGRPAYEPLTGSIPNSLPGVTIPIYTPPPSPWVPVSVPYIGDNPYPNGWGGTSGGFPVQPGTITVTNGPTYSGTVSAADDKTPKTFTAAANCVRLKPAYLSN